MTAGADGAEFRSRAIINGRLRAGEIPGGRLLYEGFKGGNQYRGQLYRTGDHVVEVYYPASSRRVSRCEVEFVID